MNSIRNNIFTIIISTIFVGIISYSVLYIMYGLIQNSYKQSPVLEATIIFLLPVTVTMIIGYFIEKNYKINVIYSIPLSFIFITLITFIKTYFENINQPKPLILDMRYLDAQLLLGCSIVALIYYFLQKVLGTKVHVGCGIINSLAIVIYIVARFIKII